MIFGKFKARARFYVDMMRGDFTPVEQDWVGKYLLWSLLDARRVVRDCRETGKPLPPFEVTFGRPSSG